jgi:formyl-CoA transferase
LHEREISGEGQWVQSSLLEAQIAIMDFQAARWLMAKDVPQQAGNFHPTGATTGVYPTTDGHMNIAASGSEIWVRLCKVLEAEHFLDHPDYATSDGRLAHRDQLFNEMCEITRTRSSDDWVQLMNDGGVPCGPIYSMDQVFEDPQVKHLGMAAPVHHPELGDIELVGQPIKLNRTPSEMRTVTPAQGEHTDTVLGELGYDADAIAALRSEKAI